MSLTYLKHTGHSHSKQVSFNPAFERVVETGLNAQGKSVEGGEYVMITGWEGMVVSTSEDWCNSMGISTYTIHAYNPQTKKTQAVADWSMPGCVIKPTYDFDLSDEYKAEMLATKIEWTKGKVRESFDHQAAEIHKFTDVIVARGRKIPVGTNGIVFWRKDGQYGLSYGLKQDDGEVVFVAARNCERNPETISEWNDDCENMMNDEIKNYIGEVYGRGQPYDTLARKILDTQESHMKTLNEEFHKSTVHEWKASKQTA